jgi:Carboxypeptidase regulatory-like domain
MLRLGFCVVTVALVSSACGGSITAPDRIPQQFAAPTDSRVTLSGQIYASVGPGDPPIADARLDVIDADGYRSTVPSDSSGFYRISVRRGSITVTASKEGYDAKQWRFDLLSDTVLNFSLDPR